MERPRYLTIFEDGSLQIFEVVPPEVFEAFDDGLYDIIDMNTAQKWVGNGWEDIEV